MSEPTGYIWLCERCEGTGLTWIYMIIGFSKPHKYYQCICFECMGRGYWEP